MKYCAICGLSDYVEAGLPCPCGYDCTTETPPSFDIPCLYCGGTPTWKVTYVGLGFIDTYNLCGVCDQRDIEGWEE